MIGNEMFLLKRGCGALVLDEIVKDILDKKTTLYQWNLLSVSENCLERMV